MTRLYAGQSLAVGAIPYAANNDRRYDQVDVELGCSPPSSRWVRRPADAVTPGRARITARAGRRPPRLAVTVVANPGHASLKIEPAQSLGPHRRRGAVRRSGPARSGRPVGDATAGVALSPGNGQIDPEGLSWPTCRAPIGSRPRFAGKHGRGHGRGAAPGRAPARDAGWAASAQASRPPSSGFIPTGKHGYLSTIGDRIYAVDVSQPAAPVITDSVVVDARMHQRRDDHGGRQVRRAHPGGRLDPEERHRDPLVRGSGPSQADRRVHRDGHRRGTQHVHLSGATSISPMTPPARSGSSTSAIPTSRSR